MATIEHDADQSMTPATSSQPIVTVIIATWNMGDTLPRALASIFAQDYDHKEIIVVDDGSTDNTSEVVAPYVVDHALTYIQIPHKRKSIAVNIGITHAKGELIVLLDADDTLPAGSISDRVWYLTTHPGDAAVFCDAVYIDQQKNRYPRTPSPEFVQSADKAEEWIKAYFVPFHPMTLMYRKEALRELGGFDERINRFQDHNMVYRLLCRFSVGYIHKTVYEYHVGTHTYLRKIKNRFSSLRSQMHTVMTCKKEGRIRACAHVATVQMRKLFAELISPTAHYGKSAPPSRSTDDRSA